MSADGKPRPVDSSRLSRLLGLVIGGAIRWPWFTIALGLVAIAASLYLSSTRLGYHTSRAALLDQREDYHRRWLKYVQEFGEQEDVVIVVQGDNRNAIIPVLDQVVAEVSAQPNYFQAVLHEIDLRKLRDKGLYYLSAQELRTIDGFLNDVEPIIRGDWQCLTPGAMASGMCAKLQQARPDQLQQAMAGAQVKLAQIGESLLTALSAPGNYKSPWPELSGSATPLEGLTSHRLLISNDRIGMVLLKLVEDKSESFIRNEKAITELRALIDRIKIQHPSVHIGLTGLPIMEHDEMQRSTSSMSTATILSFVGVFLVLVVGMGGFRHPLMAMGGLLVGLLLSLGFTTLAVGHLNILSSAFGAVLTGLGINYNVYFLCRYLEVRKGHYTVDEALLETATSVGPGIAVSAVSSAISFLVATLTGFKGVAELGLIAGGGILLCLFAALVILPAVIKVADRHRPKGSIPLPLDFHNWIKPVVTRPALALAVSAALTVALGMGATRLWYDYNLLHLEPEGLESVELEQKLLAECKESVYFALSMVKTPEEAAIRKAQFLQLPCVERVDEIATRFPTSLEEKRPVIERIRSRLAGLPAQPPQIPVASPTELGQMLSALQPVMSANLQMAQFQRQLHDIYSLLGQMPPAEYYARLSEYQRRVSTDLLSRLHLLYSVSNPEPPTPNELPGGLISRFVGHNGSHLLRIYMKGDFWDIENMANFVAQVRTVDPDVTGNPVQIYEASQAMRLSYMHAALYALITIVPVVFLSFGSLRCTLMAGLPTAAGMIQMFGFMGYLDIPMNPANMIGLSLMLGMGVENGIRITHDYLTQRGRYRMSAATGATVTLDTLTTMVGFAVLIIADHRGLQSLGRMLTLGMTGCLFSSLVILPALLAFLSRNRKDSPFPHWTPRQMAEPDVDLRPVTRPYRRDDVPEVTAPRLIRPTSASNSPLRPTSDEGRYGSMRYEGRPSSDYPG